MINLRAGERGVEEHSMSSCGVHMIAKKNLINNYRDLTHLFRVTRQPWSLRKPGPSGNSAMKHLRRGRGGGKQHEFVRRMDKIYSMMDSPWVRRDKQQKEQ